MNYIHRSLLVAALFSVASCTEDDTYAAAPETAEPSASVQAPAERVPAPVNEAAPTAPKTVDEPVEPPLEQPAPITEPAPIEESKPAPVDAPAEAPVESPAEDITDAPTAQELAITRCETRVETLRKRVTELRTAVEKLGESAAQELRDGAKALGEQFESTETKLTELRSAAQESVAQLETHLSTALDELDTAAEELAKKLP